VPSFFHGGAFWGDGVTLDSLLDLARISLSTKLTEAVRTLLTHVHTQRSFWEIHTFSGCFLVPGPFRPKVCSFDDPLWWSRMYADADIVLGSRHLGTPDFLATAKKVHDDVMAGGWGVARNGCAGGMCWKPPDKTGHCYLNACTNSLALGSSVRLHIAMQKAAGNRTDVYLQQAKMIWDWIEGSGIVDLRPNKPAVVSDGLPWPSKGNCSAPAWYSVPLSYNQGLLIDALVLLHDITGNATLLVQASRLAVAALDLLTDSADVFTEQVSSRSRIYFKGVLVRSLRLLDGKLAAYPQVLDGTIIGTNSATLQQRIGKAVRASAASARAHAESSSGLYCAKWQGPVNASCVTPAGLEPHDKQSVFSFCVGASAQTSAVHLLITNGSIGSQDARGQSLYV